jgi:osmotically-inducible protein OsmY
MTWLEMTTSTTLRTLLLLGLLPLAGCEAATNAANGAGAFVEQTAKKIEQKTDDAAITLAVKGALVEADEKLAKEVQVGSLKGVVSLAGTVPTADAKARAEQIALGVKGVVRVLNGLDVGAPR